MKYCTFCGHEMRDEENFCSQCGKPFGVQPQPQPQPQYQPQPVTVVYADAQQGLNTAIKIFLILGCIAGAFCYLIPLAWCIPMTVSLFKKIKYQQPIGTGFKICTLLFVNLIAGILLICRTEPEIPPQYNYNGYNGQQ